MGILVLTMGGTVLLLVSLRLADTTRRLRRLEAWATHELSAGGQDVDSTPSPVPQDVRYDAAVQAQKRRSGAKSQLKPVKA